MSIVEKKEVVSTGEFNINRFSGWIKGPLWETFESELRRLCRADHIEIQSIYYTYKKHSDYDSEHPLGPLSKSIVDGGRDSAVIAKVKCDF